MTTGETVLIALIAAGGPLAAQWIGSRGSMAATKLREVEESRRTRARLAVEAAVEEYKGWLASGQKSLPPLGTFIFHQFKMIELVERDALTPESLERLLDEQQKLAILIVDVAKKHDAELIRTGRVSPSTTQGRRAEPT